MATITKVLLLTIFLGLMSIATTQQFCETTDLKISQVATGKKVGSKPEWTVTISNPCLCSQQFVQLTCSGFRTVEKLNPKLVTISDGICSIDPTVVLHQNESFSFNYAWDTQYHFKLQSSEVYCD